jgi:TolA-binding protein
MKRARLLCSAALLLAASACVAGEPSPPQVVIGAAGPSPSRPAAVLQVAAMLAPLPASVRDGRRFANRSRALLVTQIQGIESIFAATPAGSPDRPAMMLRLAEHYGELEHVAEADKAHAAGPEAERADRVVRAARNAATRYYQLLTREHPRWCAEHDPEPRRCADESLYYLALELERGGDLDHARKAYLDLLQLWPQSRFVPLAYFAFGELFLDEAQRDPSKLELTEQSYSEVLKYPPPGNAVYGYAEYRLGQVYARRGDGGQALEHLQKATADAQGSGDKVLGERVEAARRGLEPRRGGSAGELGQ